MPATTRENSRKRKILRSIIRVWGSFIGCSITFAELLDFERPLDVQVHQTSISLNVDPQTTHDDLRHISSSSTRIEKVERAVLTNIAIFIYRSNGLEKASDVGVAHAANL